MQIAHLVARQHEEELAVAVSEQGRCAVYLLIPVVGAFQVLPQRLLSRFGPTFSWLCGSFRQQERLVSVRAIMRAWSSPESLHACGQHIISRLVTHHYLSLSLADQVLKEVCSNVQAINSIRAPDRGDWTQLAAG